MTSTRIQLDRDDAERFFDRVDRGDDSEEKTCWLWTGADDGSGRGLFRIDGRRIAANRIAWVVEKRETLRGHHQLHRTCSKRACVNPSHHERRKGSAPTSEDGDGKQQSPDLLPPRFAPRIVRPTDDRGDKTVPAQVLDMPRAAREQDEAVFGSGRQQVHSPEIAELLRHVMLLSRAVVDLSRRSSARLDAIEAVRADVVKLVKLAKDHDHTLDFVSFSVEKLLFHHGMMPQMPDDPVDDDEPEPEWDDEDLDDVEDDADATAEPTRHPVHPR